MKNKKITIVFLLLLCAVLFSVSCSKKEDVKTEETKVEAKEEKKEKTKEEKKKEKEPEFVAKSYENERIDCKQNKKGEMECYIAGTDKKVELGKLSDKDKELKGKALLLKYAPTKGYQSMIITSTLQLPDNADEVTNTSYWLPTKGRSEIDYGTFTSTSISFSDCEGYVWDPRMGKMEAIPAFKQMGKRLFHKGFEKDFSNIKMSTYEGKPAIYAEYVEGSTVRVKRWFNLKPFYVLEETVYYGDESETEKTTSLKINGKIEDALFEKDSIKKD